MLITHIFIIVGKKMDPSRMDPQVALSKALENRSLKEFRLALEMDGDPTRMDDKHLSIFERALSTYGCADIVAECLQKGCRVDYVSIFGYILI